MEKESGLFFSSPLWEFVGEVLQFSLLLKTEHFMLDFVINPCLEFDILFYSDIFSVVFGKFKC